jgi:hypothetical protein
LADDLIGSAVIALGARFETFESRSTLVPKLVKDLVVALSGKSKLLCRLERSKPFTLALKEHCKFKSNFVFFPNGKRPFGTGQRQFAFMNLDHRLSPP